MNNSLLNINILDHPSNRNTIVFFYTENEHSEYFKELLAQEGISYEFEIDEATNKFYFGVNKTNFKMVKKLNYLVFAKYRKPFIPYGPAKYFLILLTLLFIILAFVGYMKNS